MLMSPIWTRSPFSDQEKKRKTLSHKGNQETESPIIKICLERKTVDDFRQFLKESVQFYRMNMVTKNRVPNKFYIETSGGMSC